MLNHELKIKEFAISNSNSDILAKPSTHEPSGNIPEGIAGRE